MVRVEFDPDILVEYPRSPSLSVSKKEHNSASMKIPRNHSKLAWTCNRTLAVTGTVGLLLCQAALGQTIPNPSFEANKFTVSPGFISDNAQITGWTADQPTAIGLNPAGGDSQFADNGMIPQGTNVAFIQAGATLSTTIAGLTSGQKYVVTFRANAQTTTAGEYPNVNVSISGVPIWDITIYPVDVSGGFTNPYPYLSFEFTADAATDTLSVMNDSISTLLADDFKITAGPSIWTVEAWNDDATSGVDVNYVYTHAYSFGAAANTVINNIAFTGVAGGNPSVANQFSTVFFGNVFANDANNVTGGSRILANDFVYGGTVPAGNFQTLTIKGLTPGTNYVATIYSAGFDSPGPTIRWATFGMGEDRLTVNQDQFDNNNGIRVSCRYTADANGEGTIKIAPVNPANVSIHVYGFSNREAVSRNVPPVISVQPRSTTVGVSVPVTFAVTATGIPAPTFRWRLNGAYISGATTNSYSLTASSANAGKYDVVVANSMGSVTSLVATLNVIVGVPVTNPSFEADIFTVYPGYVSGNAPITGWTSLGGHGLNPTSDGQSPFADNGIIPNGTTAGFMQADGALSQVVSGFTIGAYYSVHYYENARTGGTVPALEVKVGTNTVVAAHLVQPVGGSNPYHEIYSDMFQATATDLELSFIKSNPQGGDTTALIDNVAILAIPAGTAPFVARNPAALTANVNESPTLSVQAIGSLPLTYQWLKNGAAINGADSPSFTLNVIQKPDEADYSVKVSNTSGSVTSAVAHVTVFEPIPDLFNSGVDDSRTALADGLTDPHYELIVNPDTNSTSAIVEDSTVFPIVGGTWLFDTTSSKWIGPQFNTVASAIGFYTYRTKINLTDRDPKTVVIMGQWSADNAGREIRVNGVSVGAPEAPAFNAYTPFTIYGTNANFVAGTNTIDFVVENVATIGYTGLRLEFIRSNVRIPPGVLPVILSQPVDQTVAVGDSATFTTKGAQGSAPLSYQWNKNGAPIGGQTTLTLTLTNVTTADAGSYTVTASNPAGSATSNPAKLAVPYRPIAGAAYGTGLGTDSTLLAGGATDRHYILSASADGNYPGPDAIVVNDGYPIQAGAWLLNGPNSKWIAPWANQNDGGTSGGGNIGGNYTYQTTVNLTGQDVSKVQLKGGWAVDNTGVDILLNGVSTGATNNGFGVLTPFTIATGLVAGTNTLDFIVNNADNATFTPNPTGLRVDIRALLSVDQPPTLQIIKSGTTYSVSWTPATAGLKLQSAPAIGGPWTEIPNASNPYPITTTGPMQFFKIVK
jgi:hypothetical protein